jgi:glycerol-3-phosphate dehydrogenase
MLRVYDFLAGVRDRRFLNREKGFSASACRGTKDAGLTGASRYTDALVDDSRLVMRVLDEACADGAVALNYVKADSLIMEKGIVWSASQRAGRRYREHAASVRAKVVINATGAWADRLREAVCRESSKVRPQRGSHMPYLVPGRLAGGRGGDFHASAGQAAAVHLSMGGAHGDRHHRSGSS